MLITLSLIVLVEAGSRLLDERALERNQAGA